MTYRLALIAVLVVGLSGCLPYYALVPEGTHEMGPYTIDTPMAWNRRVSWGYLFGGPERWTADGVGLESMFYFKGIRNKDHLFPYAYSEAIRPFRRDMRSTEIVTLFADTFQLVRGARVLRLTDMAPSDFGSWRGFSFDFEYESRHGLPMLGTGTGAVIDGELYMIVYVGLRDHYFDRYKDDVRHIFESITPS